jgi:hypothetical protein
MNEFNNSYVAWSVDAKKLITLKYLSYGCSVDAFCDYFQLGETTEIM